MSVKRDRFGLRKTAFCLLAMVCAGCVGGVDTQVTSSSGGQLEGSWVQSSGGCEQRLILAGDGRFAMSARISVDDRSWGERIGGTYTLSGPSSGGETPIRFDPEDEITPELLLYCNQWRLRGILDLAFEAIKETTGVDAESLLLRTEIGANAIPVTIGTDSARTDRLALYQDLDGKIKIVTFDAPSVVPHPLYQALFSDPSRGLETLKGFRVVNIPQNGWSGSFSGAAPGTILQQIILNVTSAVEVSFGNLDNSGLQPCNFSLYADTSFFTLQSEFLFAQDQTTELRTWNPYDPAELFVRFPLSSEGEGVTAYLLPLAVTAPEGGGDGCGLNIRARPRALRLVEDLVRNQQDPPRVYPAPGPMPRLLVLPVGSASALHILGLNSMLVSGAARLYRELVFPPPLTVDGQGAPPSFDYLDLLQMRESAEVAVVTITDGRESLSLFAASDHSAGLGPFLRYKPPLPAGSLTLPSSVTVQLAPETPAHDFRLTLAQAARIALWSEGMLQVSGELRDSQGELLGLNSGGAPDAAGFQIVRALPAGEYNLTVRMLGAAGELVVRLEEEAGLPFTDDGLASCMIDAGWAAGSVPNDLTCIGGGIASLAGLESLPLLRRLVVNRNRITDLSPLANSGELRELSLDGNRVADLSPLAGLKNLERLALAGNPLDPQALAVLSAMEKSLTYLNLRATTFTPQEVAQLKLSLVNTTIIAPDGSVLE